jgi:hypothetical protein
MNGKHNKWLLRKVSGSRGKYTHKPDFADTRHEKSTQAEILPFRKSMRKRGGTHLDTTLVKRWLHGQVGRNFDLVYSDFLKRIQPKYLESYKECIFYYVTKAHELIFDENGVVVELFSNLFYIDRDTNVLQKHTESALKEARPIYLTSGTYSSFLYDRETRIWESRSDRTKVVIRDEKKILTKDDFSTIDFVLKNTEKLNELGQQAVNSFVLQYQNTDILLSRKDLLSIHFDISKGLNQYYLLYEVAKDASKDWKVIFEGNEIIEVQRIKQGILLQ